MYTNIMFHPIYEGHISMGEMHEWWGVGDTNGSYSGIYTTDKDNNLNMGDAYCNRISNGKNICYPYL